MNLKLTYLIFLLVMAHSAHAVHKHMTVATSSQLVWVFLLIGLTVVVFALCAYFWLNHGSRSKRTSMLTNKSPVTNPPNLQHRHKNNTLTFPRPDSKHSKESPATSIMLFIIFYIFILFLMSPIILFGQCKLM